MGIKSRLAALVKALGSGDLWGGTDRDENAEEIASHFFSPNAEDKSENPGIQRMGTMYGMGCIACNIAASRSPHRYREDDRERNAEWAARHFELIGVASDASEEVISEALVRMAQEGPNPFTDPEIKALRKQLVMMFKRGRREEVAA